MRIRAAKPLARGAFVRDAESPDGITTGTRAGRTDGSGQTAGHGASRANRKAGVPHFSCTRACRRFHSPAVQTHHAFCTENNPGSVIRDHPAIMAGPHPTHVHCGGIVYPDFKDAQAGDS
jgi:hypothetical protein